MKQICKLLAIGMCLLIILSICGCGKNKTSDLTNDSTSCGNIVMGNGKFAYNNGFIYFTDLTNIYEYDTVSKKTISFNSKSDDVRSMFVKDQYVYFACNGLNRITKDGKKKNYIFESDNGTLQMFVDGKTAYYLDGIEGILYSRNIETSEETEIYSSVLAYFVDQQSIYIVAKENGVNSLYVSNKSTLELKKKLLSFEPISIYSTEDGIYLSAKSTYQIIQCKSDDNEIQLPISAVYYQVLNNHLYYLDSETFENGCFSLKSYDILTGKISLIFENVFDFNIVNKNYICVQCSSGEDAEYKLFDVSSGTTCSMKTGEE